MLDEIRDAYTRSIVTKTRHKPNTTPTPIAHSHPDTYPAEIHATPKPPKGNPVNAADHPTIDEAAVTEILNTRVDAIRAKARRDHADELQQAGHTEAAEFLRRPR